ncbi:hypothetical protein [Kitasatospora sp. NBC_01300]|uniref:hypothetical protein n=1 Tax=Kitasatospora sp. NBC_01300 TaxID=2903574 RepID=UPI00352D3213|nr:hypothetical protein OG556_40380 [Kitasatospora sp. NBC_01300]
MAPSVEPEPKPASAANTAAIDVLDLDFGSGWMHAVEFDYGRLRSPERDRSPHHGGGFSIELPAVLDLLEHIATGAVSPRTAREVLQQAAANIYLPVTTVHFDAAVLQRRCERDQGSCPLCELRQDWFEGMLNECDRWWECYTQPETFPYIAGAETVHTVACPATRRKMPDRYERPTGEDYRQELRRYAHSVDPTSGRSALDLGSRYPGWKAMTADETKDWMKAHTGPKGGQLYKLCQRCAPTP